MVLKKFGGGLKKVMDRIKRSKIIDKDLVDEVVKDLQRTLLTGDVNVLLVKDLCANFRERALNEKPANNIDSRTHVMNILYEELVSLLGAPRKLKLKHQRVMMVGLYGNGKTTTAGKLALYITKKLQMKVGMIGADIHRPGAVDQLRQLAEEVDVPFYGEDNAKKAHKVVERGLKELGNNDVVIIDTAGRDQLDEDLIKEMKRIAKVAQPDEIFLVLDAAVGQQAGPTARRFNEEVGVTGVILTKLDGSAKGGGALSAVAETNAPIMFVGDGELMRNLEPFDPDRFISRLLGTPDIQDLVDFTEEEIDQTKAVKLTQRIMSGKFNLNDMYEQMKMVSGEGKLSRLMKALPANIFRQFGFGRDLDPTAVDSEEMEENLARYGHIIDSMTAEEKDRPEVIKQSRQIRIARGSGTAVADVRDLIKQYKQTRKMVQGMKGNRQSKKMLQKALKEGDFPEWADLDDEDLEDL